MTDTPKWKSLAKEGSCYLCSEPVDPQQHVACAEPGGVLPAHLACVRAGKLYKT